MCIPLHMKSKLNCYFYIEFAEKVIKFVADMFINI